ncbi:PREDICTED: Down syndrome cell adhesion molecule homolog [Cyprinodon variegatus]|uniref:Down syndrome cell adhesion molecule homolog n=1 Tax=Cyprinodon variegatus TaxID=28743 RepID=UPI000742BC72|nr:PREDICTED: Down syndrome cell adhesion molecule homolog [Cyprinodon variegatus]
MSNASNVLTFAPNGTVPPDPPVIGLEDVTNNKISLFWTPGFEGDSPITGFYLEFKEANASWDYTETVVDFYANETEGTIIEINPSTYNIRMFAKNSLGTSNASNVLTASSRCDVPVAPLKGGILAVFKRCLSHIRGLLSTLSELLMLSLKESPAIL